MRQEAAPAPVPDSEDLRMRPPPAGRPADAPPIAPPPERGTPSYVEPVTIDESGRIFNARDEQVVVPGLEPEKVLRALAQDEAGEGQSLDDVMAELGRCPTG